MSFYIHTAVAGPAGSMCLRSSKVSIDLELILLADRQAYLNSMDSPYAERPPGTRLRRSDLFRAHTRARA